MGLYINKELPAITSFLIIKTPDLSGVLSYPHIRLQEYYGNKKRIFPFPTEINIYRNLYTLLPEAAIIYRLEETE